MTKKNIAKWNLSRVITPCNLTYGAPMGRPNVGQRPGTGKIYDKRVKLIDGYDAGGAYWGCGAELRVYFTGDLSYIEFYRKGEND